MTLYELGAMSVTDEYRAYPPSVKTTWTADDDREFRRVLDARDSNPGIGPAVVGFGVGLLVGALFIGSKR
jgi:hypothetical protein